MPARKSATSQPPLRVAIVGCGGMARHHAAAMLRHQDIVQIPAVCEPSSSTYARFAELFHDVGVTPPPNYPDLAALLQNAGGALDAAFIITPHALHHDQAAACMEAGLDVLLEKPMVMNTAEARSLIATRDRTGRRLVVAFNGSLSPQIRTAVKLLRSGELGEILNIHGVVWQGWNGHTQNTWRQAPAIAGGGFLFDTGAHLLNTVADLAGEPVVEVAAWLDNRGRPVDILGSVMARLASGVLITLSGCGDTIESCASDVRVFCTQGILRTGVWGETLEVQRAGEADLAPVNVPVSHGAWEQFLHVCRGEIDNPSPPEVGLRMAILWDMIRTSAQRGGIPVTQRDAEAFMAETASVVV
jgi:predicted dehydrogenase